MIMPLNTARRRYLIVDVDTQRHFFTKPGVICVQNHRRVLANILRVIKWAKQNRVRMISTVQILPTRFTYYTTNIIDREYQKKIHHTLYRTYASLEATDCTDLPLSALQRYNQLILHKRCFDPFEEPRADRVLSELQAEQFVLIGAPTVLGLLGRRKNVTVLSDATGAYNRMAGGVAIRHVAERGARITNTNAFLNGALTCR